MYIFDINQLKPFDIILVRFPNDRISNIIRRVCNSEFSHAIVYLGNSSFIEAFDPIVTLFSAQRYFFTNLDNIKVLRLNDEHLAKFNLEKAEACLRGLAYCNYSSDLLTYIKAKNISEKTIKTFNESGKWIGGVVCSSLVTLPYSAGGIDISNTSEPYYSHFGDIEKYIGFEDVTNIVLTKTDRQVIDDTFDYFSLVETGSILEKQSNAVKKLNDIVESIFLELKSNKEKYFDIRIDENDLQFSNWEDVYPYITRWFNTEKGKEIDEKIFESIRETEYNNLWFEEVHNKRRLFFPFHFIMVDSTDYELKNEPIEYFQSTKESLAVYLLKIEKDEYVIFQNFSKCPSKTFHTLLDMYRSFADLIRSSINQYDAIITAKQSGQL